MNLSTVAKHHRKNCGPIATSKGRGGSRDFSFGPPSSHPSPLPDGEGEEAEEGAGLSSSLGGNVVPPQASVGTDDFHTHKAVMRLLFPSWLGGVRSSRRTSLVTQ